MTKKKRKNGLCNINKVSKVFMQDRIQTEHVKIWMERDVIRCTFSDNLELDLNIAKRVVKERMNFSMRQSYACLVDMRNLKFMTKEAREYLAKEGAQYIKAGALITGSPLSNALGNIFLSLNKPNVPTKLFNDEEQAFSWLKKYS
jgi:hypothetical protein